MGDSRRSSSRNLFAYIHRKNEKPFSFRFRESALQQPMMLKKIFIVYQRTTHSMKRKRSAISGRDVFNQVRRKHILGCDSYCGTCVDSNSSGKQIRTLLLSQNGNFLSGLDKTHKSSEPRPSTGYKI